MFRQENITAAWTEVQKASLNVGNWPFIQGDDFRGGVMSEFLDEVLHDKRPDGGAVGVESEFIRPMTVKMDIPGIVDHSLFGNGYADVVQFGRRDADGIGRRSQAVWGCMVGQLLDQVVHIHQGRDTGKILDTDVKKVVLGMSGVEGIASNSLADEEKLVRGRLDRVSVQSRRPISSPNFDGDLLTQRLTWRWPNSPRVRDTERVSCHPSF